MPFTLLPEVETDDVHVYFTRTEKAFYIISLRKPTSPAFKLQAPLPILWGDRIRLVGAKEDRVLRWEWEDGTLSIEVDEAAVESTGGGIAWVFELQYNTEAKSSTARFEDEL
jgi:hypothetical protein